MKLSKTNIYCALVFIASIPMALILKGSFGEWMGLMMFLATVIGVKNTYQAKVDNAKQDK